MNGDVRDDCDLGDISAVGDRAPLAICVEGDVVAGVVSP